MRIKACRFIGSGCSKNTFPEALEANIHQVFSLDVSLSNILPQDIRVIQHLHGTPLAYQTHIRTGFHQWNLMKSLVTFTVHTHQKRQNNICRCTLAYVLYATLIWLY